MAKGQGPECGMWPFCGERARCTLNIMHRDAQSTGLLGQVVRIGTVKDASPPSPSSDITFRRMTVGAGAEQNTPQSRVPPPSSGLSAP